MNDKRCKCGAVAVMLRGDEYLCMACYEAIPVPEVPSPSRPAMAAAVDIIQDADGLDCIIIDSEQLVLAAIIDIHFAPYLEAVEVLREIANDPANSAARAVFMGQKARQAVEAIDK